MNRQEIFAQNLLFSGLLVFLECYLAIFIPHVTMLPSSLRYFIHKAMPFKECEHTTSSLPFDFLSHKKLQAHRTWSAKTNKQNQETQKIKQSLCSFPMHINACSRDMGQQKSNKQNQETKKIK